MTCGKFSQLLKYIGQEGEVLENLRLSLCEKSFFNPYSQFKSLDLDDKKYIDREDLQRFLQKFEVQADPDVLNLFLSHHNKNRKLQIGYIE